MRIHPALPLLLLGTSAPSFADDAVQQASEPITAKRSYLPADFARYAPRSALDMVRQIPGFAIAEIDQSARGLGQASGNVLVNSSRLASKSDAIGTQLSRIQAADVVRIDLVDAATLKVPGLTGVVANVIVRSSSFTGQFSWNPQFRAHYAQPSWFDGSVSVSGKSGLGDYSLSLANETNHAAAGGPTFIRDANGMITEARSDVSTFDEDRPKLSASLSFHGPGSSVGNISASYQRVWDRTDETSLRSQATGADYTRLLKVRTSEWHREFSGDFEFRLGPGRLKLIGLDRRSHEPYEQSVIARPNGGGAASGDLFQQTGERSEDILRGEYTWRMLGGDWQAAGEAAFNRLETTAGLGTLNANGTFDIVPFSAASGGVKEERYEGSLSYSRPLSKTLSLQLNGAVERSTLAQTGANGLIRHFVRPKGSVALAWKPSSDFDLNVKLRRQVGQLSFYDFLARVFLDNNNANTGNSQLKPRQDWTLEAEANTSLGRWGSTKFHVIAKETQDYITLIPIAGGESVGNVPRARVRYFENVTRLNLDPLGFKGARFDIQAFVQNAHYKDPVSGSEIGFSSYTESGVTIDFRHDIPSSNWAWGGEYGYYGQSLGYRLGEVGHAYEGPNWGMLFIENKNVRGLTLRLQANNLLNARQHWDRTVFAGTRGVSPVAFTETRNRLIGPIFSFQVKGNI